MYDNGKSTLEFGVLLLEFGDNTLQTGYLIVVRDLWFVHPMAVAVAVCSFTHSVIVVDLDTN